MILTCLINKLRTTALAFGLLLATPGAGNAYFSVELNLQVSTLIYMGTQIGGPAGLVISPIHTIGSGTGITTQFQVDAAYIDSDGHADMVLARTTQTGLQLAGALTLIKGKPVLSSMSTTEIATWSLVPIAVRTADMDGDTDTDIVTLDKSPTTEKASVSVFINNGNGTFTRYTTALSTSGSGGVTIKLPTALALGDLDGDQKIDIAAVNNAAPSKLTIIRNASTPGQAAFGTPAYFTLLDVGASDVEIADIEDDKDLDVIVAIPGAAVIEVGTPPPHINLFRNITGNGALNFASEQVATPEGTSFLYPDQLVAGELDDTPGTDLAIYDNHRSIESLIIMPNAGSANFPAAQLIETNVKVRDLRAADLNGDGHLDIYGAVVAQDEENQSRIMIAKKVGASSGNYNISLASFSTQTLLPMTVAVGNFNGTNLPEIASGTAADNKLHIMTVSIPPPPADLLLTAQ